MLNTLPNHSAAAASAPKSLKRSAAPSQTDAPTRAASTQNSQPKQGAALAQALAAAAWVTHHVAQGQSLTQVLTDTAKLLPAAPSLRGACQDLSYHVQRHWGRADALLFSLSKKPASQMDAGLLALLRVSLSLLCDSDADSARYEPHTLVDQAVRAVPAVLACRLTQWVNQQPQRPAKLVLSMASNTHTDLVAGFVNGVLRGYLRDKARCDAAACQTVSGEWNHPAWWVSRLEHDYPRDWQALLRANNQKPVMTLRYNARVAAVADIAAAQAVLQAVGIESRTVAACPNALSLARAVPVDAIPHFQDGWFSVQDAAAQRCVELLDFQPKQRVLDACAAPGGKTAHILERADVSLTAIDVSEPRLVRVRDTLARIGGTLPDAWQDQTRLIAADAANLDAWWDGVAFDRILLDAPCSASGVVRRHPDVRWLRRESDLKTLVQIQAQLLDQLWRTLARGGQLLYVTCSVFHCEGQDQIAAFLQRTRNAKLIPSPGHTLPVLPRVSAAVQRVQNQSQFENNDSMVSDGFCADGFYYARLQKAA